MVLKEGKSFYTRGNTKKAIATLEQALAANPKGDEAMVVIANCHLDAGRMPKALQLAQQAVEANPDNADAYLVIGAVQQQNGKIGEARTAYEKYLKLAPKGQYAREIRSILSSMK